MAEATASLPDLRRPAMQQDDAANPSTSLTTSRGPISSTSAFVNYSFTAHRMRRRGEPAVPYRRRSRERRWERDHRASCFPEDGIRHFLMVVGLKFVLVVIEVVLRFFHAGPVVVIRRRRHRHHAIVGAF